MMQLTLKFYLFNKVLVHFYLSYFHALYLVSTPTYIFCIVHDLGAIGVAWKIQVMDSLQIDDLFMIDSWVYTTH